MFWVSNDEWFIFKKNNNFQNNIFYIEVSRETYSYINGRKFFSYGQSVIEGKSNEENYLEKEE